MYLIDCQTHLCLFPKVLLWRTCTIDIKPWVPSYELMWAHYIKKYNQPCMQLQNRGTYYRYGNKQHNEQYTATTFVCASLYENWSA